MLKDAWHIYIPLLNHFCRALCKRKKKFQLTDRKYSMTAKAAGAFAGAGIGKPFGYGITR